MTNGIQTYRAGSELIVPGLSGLRQDDIVRRVDGTSILITKMTNDGPRSAYQEIIGRSLMVLEGLMVGATVENGRVNFQPHTISDPMVTIHRKPQIGRGANTTYHNIVRQIGQARFQ